MKWSVFTSVRYLRGTYDGDILAELLRFLPRGGVFYDVGAHIGYYALAAARQVGPDGQVIAFEPAPVNAHLLERHVRANRVGNVQLIRAGVTDRAGQGGFDHGPGTGRGHLAATGEVSVPLVALDELRATNRIPAPDVIKMDIEGAELRALNGARRLLEERRPVLLLSMHGEEMERDCATLLKSLGYHLKFVRRSTALATPPHAAGRAAPA